jgi:glycosyltransferase involved in cell wall biosynthesis
MDNTLKILIFNWQCIKNPLGGGAEVHLQEVFERIAAMGHEVVLYSSMFTGVPREENINGIKVFRQGGRYFFNFFVPFAYFSKFKKQKFDIIIDDVNKIPFYTPLYIKGPLLGITHHLFGKSIFLEVSFPIALYVFLMEKLVKPIYKKIHWIVGSPSTEKELTEWGFPKDQVTIINYCVNRKIFKQTGIGKSKEHLIGYLGRLKKYKSIEHLIQASKIVREIIPDLNVMIVGDGDNRKNLEELTKNLELQDTIEFKGFVSEEDKVAYLQKMHFVVNTSSKEGWGLTVVEANACGRTVIAANVQGLRDSVVNEKTGLLYEYGNVQELAQKIIYLLKNEDVVSELEKNAIDWAASFDWDVAAKKTMGLIEDCLRRYNEEQKSDS